jgi:hypothetical protein
MAHRTALLIALSLAAPAPAVASPCFDWAVAAKLDSQTYLGMPDPGPDAISIDAAFQWEASVRATLIGQGAPARMSLVTVAHTEVPHRAAQRMLLFVRNGGSPRPILVARGMLSWGGSHRTWTAEAATFAKDHGLSQCGAK